MDRDELDALIKRIIPKIENYGEKNKCWPWTGKRSGDRLRVRRSFQYGQPVNMYTQADKPYGEVRHAGKFVRVNRVVYEFLVPTVTELPVKWRLANLCGDTLCCNPEHWSLRLPGEAIKPKKKKEKEDPVLDEEALLRQDCEDLLDQIFSVGGPSTLDDVVNHIYMVDFDRSLIIQTLRKMGKGHICNE